MHILELIYVSYAILNNIFIHLDRISSNMVQDYQLVPEMSFTFSFRCPLEPSRHCT
jgi:hypothetical protein